MFLIGRKLVECHRRQPRQARFLGGAALLVGNEYGPGLAVETVGAIKWVNHGAMTTPAQEQGKGVRGQRVVAGDDPGQAAPLRNPLNFLLEAL